MPASGMDEGWWFVFALNRGFDREVRHGLNVDVPSLMQISKNNNFCSFVLGPGGGGLLNKVARSARRFYPLPFNILFFFTKMAPLSYT